MREYNVGAVYINDNVYAGETNIPLLKGNQGYSISRVVKTSGTGTPGSYDTYTIYINTDPESIVGTFQVWNGTGNIGDMTKAEYDTDNDGIVDNAERVNNHTVDIDVPSNAKFTDTVYDDTAITNRVTTLENAGYITKSVSDLVNYYTKSETYTKQEVNTLVDTIPKFAIEVVNSLPTHDISTTTIYLVRDDSSTGDIYKEYIYVNNTWEILGTQRVDLSNYYTKQETYNKTEVDNAIASIEGNEIIITDDPTEPDDQKIWVDTNGTLPYVNSEVNIGATNVSNTPVWFKKSKNLFNKNTFVAGDITNGNATIRLSSRQALYLEAGTYTFSTTQTNTFQYILTMQSNGAPPLVSEPTWTYSSSWISDTTKTFTITTPGYFCIYLRKANNTNIALNEISGFNYYLTKGSTATTEDYIAPSIIADNTEFYSQEYINEMTKAKLIDISSYKTSNVASITRANVSKVGNVYYLNLAFAISSSPNKNNPFFQNLPFKPTFTTELNYLTGDGGVMRRCLIDTNGNINSANMTAGTFVTINGVVITEYEN